MSCRGGIMCLEFMVRSRRNKIQWPKISPTQNQYTTQGETFLICCESQKHIPHTIGEKDKESL